MNHLVIADQKAGHLRCPIASLLLFCSSLAFNPAAMGQTPQEPPLKSWAPRVCASGIEIQSADTVILEHVSLDAVPFHIALQRLRASSGLRIFIDPYCQRRSSVDIDTPVSLNADRIAAKDAMEKLAQQVDQNLHAYTAGDIITIAEGEKRESFMEVRIYDLAPLVSETLSPEQQAALRLAVSRFVLFEKRTAELKTAEDDLKDPAAAKAGCLCGLAWPPSDTLADTLIREVANHLGYVRTDSIRTVIEDCIEPMTWDTYQGEGKIRVYDRMLIVRTFPEIHDRVARLLAQLQAIQDRRKPEAPAAGVSGK